MFIDDKKEQEYPCPNCDENKPEYREPCPNCEYEDKKIKSSENK